MGFLDQPGGYDENSLWYLMRDPSERALDSAIKTQRALEAVAVQAAANSQGSNQLTRVLEAKVLDLENKLLSLGLYTRTILQVLHEKELLTLDEFQAKKKEIDLLDGKEDNR